MSSARVEVVLWVLAIGLTGLAAHRWRGEPSAPVPATFAASSLEPARSLDAALLGRAGSEIIEGDPFRLERRPSSVAFGTRADSAPLPPPAAVPTRPALRLIGFTGGPPWRGVLEGVPGREGGVVVRVGDVLGDLRVRAVMRDTVIVQGADTTWKLTLRHAWP